MSCRYDSGTDAWAEANKIPTTRTLSSGEGHATAGFAGTRIHVFGGRYPPSTSLCKLNEYYETTSDTWGTANQMPTKRWGASAAALSSGSHIFIAGGVFSPPWTSYDRLEIYNVGTDAWHSGNDMPTVRYYAAATMHGELMYVVGGEAGFSASTIVELYNSLSDSWTTAEAMPTARSDASLCVESMHCCQ